MWLYSKILYISRSYIRITGHKINLIQLMFYPFIFVRNDNKSMNISDQRK